jgi:hypothetical protein
MCTSTAAITITEFLTTFTSRLTTMLRLITAGFTTRGPGRFITAGLGMVVRGTGRTDITSCLIACIRTLRSG